MLIELTLLMLRMRVVLGDMLSVSGLPSLETSVGLGALNIRLRLLTTLGADALPVRLTEIVGLIALLALMLGTGLLIGAGDGGAIVVVLGRNELALLILVLILSGMGLRRCTLGLVTALALGRKKLVSKLRSGPSGKATLATLGLACKIELS